MASSSESSAAHQAPGAPPRPLPPPPPEEVAAFYALIEKRVTASVLNRHSRCAELSERAARHAARLWGDNSLVVANLRINEAASLRNTAIASTSSSEQEALRRHAWAILVPVHALLLRRLSDNTLLPGTIKEEEVMYDARALAFTYKAKDKPVPSEAVLQGLGVVLGYDTLLNAVNNTLALLSELRGVPCESARSFVLTMLDAIPRTVTMEINSTSEDALVDMIETHMKPQNFEASFCAAVLRKWRSKAVTDVLRARGVLQTGVAAAQQGRHHHPVLQALKAVFPQVRLLLRSKPASVPTSRRSGCESARGRPATRWSAPSANSSSAPAVALCGTAARSITRSTGGRTKRIATSWTKRDGRR